MSSRPTPSQRQGGEGGLGPPRPISPDRGLTDLDAKLEQFAADVRCEARPRAYRNLSNG
jgi:hypothetical protein